MRQIVLVIHDIRSCYNVGAMLRTADGLGVERVYLTGYTPYPLKANDDRLPHLAQKINRQIHKSALGAEQTVNWQAAKLETVLTELKAKNFVVAALEETKSALPLQTYKPADKLAIIVGSEVGGLRPAVLAHADLTLQIPMLGQKESFNVAQAAAMALYHCRFA